MLRRLLSLLAALFLASSLHAAVWQSAEYGIAVTLPDGPDWVPMPEAVTPTIRVLTGVANQRTNSMFNLAVQIPLAGKKLDAPEVAETIKKDLTALGYAIFGHSKTGAGTTQWLQFPVNHKDAKGVVRATAANGQIFTVTMLRGDGKSALEDTDLVRTGASFRITNEPSVAIAPVAPSPSGSPAGATEKVVSPASPATPVEESGEMDYKRIGIAAGVLIFLLLMVWGIIGSGKK